MAQRLSQAQFRAIFSRPCSLAEFDLPQWEQLLRILRGADMLGAFYYFLKTNELLPIVPDFFQAHLHSAKRYSDRQVQQIKTETDYLCQTLQTINCQPTFLKGAAYVLDKTSNHEGRVMTDIDILVYKDDLALVETTLKRYGWVEKKLDDYDQQYYRKWAHELPPFNHPERGVTLDIHHTIIPPISGIEIPESLLFGTTKHTESGKITLSDPMMVIHCIIHLFYNEDYEKSFRDIFDIHLLLTDYEEKYQLTSICQLADELGFSKEIYYACALTDAIFKTQRVKNLTGQSARYTHVTTTNFFIKNIILPAIMPHHDLINTPWSNFARTIMFLRGHYLKMPLKVLVPHIWVKFNRALVMLVMGPHHYEK